MVDIIGIGGTLVSLTSPTLDPFEHEAPVDRTHHPSTFIGRQSLLFKITSTWSDIKEKINKNILHKFQ